MNKTFFVLCTIFFFYIYTLPKTIPQIGKFCYAFLHIYAYYIENRFFFIKQKENCQYDIWAYYTPI